MKSLLAMLLLCGALGAQTATYPLLKEPEPIDVPAVEIYDDSSPVVACLDDVTNPHVAHIGIGTYCLAPRRTCTDKSRILEHDEATPPKWWCRKVQP